MSMILDKIRSRGYWRVVIYPTRFIKDRISPITVLYPLVEKTSVQLRGWDFPHVDRKQDPHIDLDWISQEVDWNHSVEVWRFYQSGQFIHYAGIGSDWRDQSGLWPADKGWTPGALLGIVHTVFRFTEIFEFASRLALTDAGDEQMHIEVTLSGLQGRKLFVDSERREPFFSDYKASIKELPYSVDL
ncbi:MAG: hypothetical protein ACRENT_03215, partial [Thermodesulfobacteriota bacterium]